MNSLRLHLSFAIPAAALLLAAPSPLTPSLAAQSPFDALHVRSVGPAVMGGRISDVEVDPSNRATIYLGTAAGGIWKTVNNGTTWDPVFDGQDDNSFGDIAIAPSNTDVVWAGTGEQNNRNSSSWGGGVYRSTDAGETWQFLGLKETGAIGRVIVHPDNPDVAWVAAVGHLWKPSMERGVFKTTNGGQSWDNVLFVDSLTGASELAIDPRNPDVLYASTYQRLRSQFGFNGGGPGSALWKSTDGGATWNRLENGMPLGDKGRIGIAVSHTNPNVVVTTVQHAQQSGLYKSEDAGASFEMISRSNPRPMYYSKPVIDPNNGQRIWLMGVQPVLSEDGGKTFRRLPSAPTYDLGLKDDHHSLWIEPGNSDHLLLGGDGGLHESWDGGYTYRRINNFAIGQFYRIAVDDRDPYYIYGGLQDAHSFMGPSSTTHWLGILNADWRQIGFSDGTGHSVDLKGHRYVYSTSSSGNLTRVDAETGDRYNIQPRAPDGERYRFDWVAPILASQHKAGTVYLGGNKLLISNDFGSSWTATKDLTRQVNRDTMYLAGMLNTDITIARNDGVSNFSEITTIAESPLDEKVLWVGTDDGNVQLSRDGGKNWEEVSSAITGVPNGSFVDRIVASGASKGTAYVTIERHRSGDFAPHIFRTTDYGKSWTKVVNGMATNAPVRSIVEYPGQPNVLFAGTERFVYYTTNSGDNWTRLKANLPTVRYDELVIQKRTKDLVFGTHGRAIWVLDDASPFAEWTPEVSAKAAHLFSVRQATIINYWADVSTAAQGIYAAENPVEGAVFSYHLSTPAQKVAFTVTNSNGRVIRELTGPAEPGQLHRINWDLRYPPAGGGFGGRGGGSDEVQLPVPAHNIGPRGFYVSPGTYTVTMDVDGTTQSREFQVRADPAAMVTLAEHREREEFLWEAQEVQGKLVKAIADFRTMLSSATAADSARLGPLMQQLGLVQPAAAAGRRRGPSGPLGALAQLPGAWNGSGARHGGLQAPTKTQRAVLDNAKALLSTVERELRRD